MAAKKQPKRSRSFELFIISRFSTSLDTARSAKSRFIFTVAKELNETSGSRFALRRRRSPTEKPDGSFKLTQPQSGEQGPANSPVYDQAISTFKSGDRVTRSRSDDAIDYAMIITELAEPPLYGRNQ